MKTKRVVIFILIFCFICSFFVSCGEKEETATYYEIGLPLKEKFPKDTISRCVWDMFLWGDKLFIGSGDYDKNTGPAEIWAYDISLAKWENTYLTNEEAITKFISINDKLIIPGVDPRDDWTFGNYYELKSNGWQKYRNIPKAIHTFDMVEYNGKIYAGIGAEEGYSPIVCSNDGGNSFSFVNLYKNGEVFNTNGLGVVRAYDFYVYDNHLYAIIKYGKENSTYGLFRVEDDFVDYCEDLTDKLKFIRPNANLLCGKTEYKGVLYVSTGYLYYSKNAQDFYKLSIPDTEFIYDIMVKEDGMYLLCGKEHKNGKILISIYKNTTGDVNCFVKELSFYYSTTPLCFEKDNNAFYIGIGNRLINSSKNGMVLKIPYSDK